MPKKTLLLIFTCLILQSNLWSERIKTKSFSIEIPEDVEFESKPEQEFYTFIWGKPTDRSLLMLYPNPMPSSETMVKPMADMMVVSFEDQMKKKKDQFTSIKTDRENVEMGIFKGERLTFTLVSTEGLTIHQLIFVLHDGEKIWNGQLTATIPDSQSVAERIISSTKALNEAEEETEQP